MSKQYVEDEIIVKVRGKRDKNSTRFSATQIHKTISEASRNRNYLEPGTLRVNQLDDKAFIDERLKNYLSPIINYFQLTGLLKNNPELITTELLLHIEDERKRATNSINLIMELLDD